MFLIHEHWQAIDLGLIFLYYNFHGIKNISYQGSWDLHGLVFKVWWYMCGQECFCVMFPIFYRFYDCMEISIINLRTMHNYNIT